MENMAQWGPMGFVVSPEAIIPFEGLSTSIALKSDSENDTSGTSPSNTKGLELQPVTVSTTYVRGAGVDPRAKIEEWGALVGSSYPLYIGGERFGPKMLKLKKVDISDVVTTNAGVFLTAKLSLSFEEKPVAVSKSVSTSSKSSTPAKKKALLSTASKDEKATKKVGGNEILKRVRSV